MSSLQPSRWPALLLGLVLGAAVGIGAWIWFDQADEETDATVETEVTTTTVAAETRDLISFTEWTAQLTAGEPAVIAASGRGTITRTSEVGATVHAGDVVAEIDGAPVVALYGTVPQFRALDPDADEGADVEQLEANLVALGYDPDGTVTVDDTYTYNTGLMVERWETDLGIEEPDDTVDLGQIAFIAGPSEVTSRTAAGSQAAPGQPLLVTVTLAESGFLANPVDADAVGALAAVDVVLADGVALADVTLDDTVVPAVAVTDEPDPDRTDAYEVQVPDGAVIAATILDVFDGTEAGRPTHRWELPQGAIELEVDVDNIDEFEVGLPVVVELPDGTLIDAVVDEIGDVARTTQVGQNAVTVLDVVIEPTEPLTGTFSAGPVTIRVEDDAVLGATVIPVRALIALAEGGHAIDIDGRGLVAVELGTFEDGWVEVTNGVVAPGDMIVVPA